ncbi:MAG: hypothetical protein JWM68_235 [Verrucomicrobiales bacterium]|nr:hypothetical protein [Verrucomicrobiales bacterium]
MTPTQKARLAGFNATLRQRGVSVFLQPDDYEFTAVVEKVVPDEGGRMPSKEVRTASRIHIRKTDLQEFLDEEEETIEVGSVFHETDGLTGKLFTHRVTGVDEHSTEIKAIYDVETTVAEDQPEEEEEEAP